MIVPKISDLVFDPATNTAHAKVTVAQVDELAPNAARLQVSRPGKGYRLPMALVHKIVDSGAKTATYHFRAHTPNVDPPLTKADITFLLSVVEPSTIYPATYP